MIRVRTAAAVLVAATFTLGGTSVAYAMTPEDQQFTDAVTALEIPTTPDEDIPAVGHRICDWLTVGLSSNINPVPTVRGVVNRLENAGMTKKQSVGLMRAAVAVYCPQHTRFIGR